MDRVVGVNERGLRVGEDHGRAKLSDRDVELIRELGDERDARGRRVWGKRRLARKFGVAPQTIVDILDYRTRAQVPTEWRPVKTSARYGYEPAVAVA